MMIFPEGFPQRFLLIPNECFLKELVLDWSLLIGNVTYCAGKCGSQSFFITVIIVIIMIIIIIITISITIIVDITIIITIIIKKAYAADRRTLWRNEQVHPQARKWILIKGSLWHLMTFR